MIVLSLFDGMGCGYEALKRAGIPVKKYYASEINKAAMQVAKKNHPDIIHLGDVNGWRTWDIDKPDLIIGGSPCQGFSFAGQQLAFDDPRSMLFFTMMDIINHYQPDYRYLENVVMKKKHLAVITNYMGCDPMLMDSALVSAQNRERYYWCNWRITMPADKGIRFHDIVQPDRPDTDYVIDPVKFKSDLFTECVYQIEGDDIFSFSSSGRGGGRVENRFYFSHEFEKAHTLTRTGYTCRAFTGHVRNGMIAPPSITELELLQTARPKYTEGVSESQRRMMLGNGWTIDMIAHHFSTIGQPIDPHADGRLL